MTHPMLRDFGRALALALACATTAFLLPPMPAGAATPSAAPPELPLRDFFRSPERAYFRLSEDGRWLGFLQPARGDGGDTPRRNLFVQPLEDGRPAGEPRQLTRESARDIADYRFKGGSTVLYVKDFGGDENFHVVAVDVRSGQVRDLTPGDQVRAEILDDLPDDPEHVLVSHNRRDPKAFDVLRLNVRTGEETLVAANPGNVVGWVTDHAGRLRVAVASDGSNNTVMVRDSDRGEFRPIIRTNFRTEVSPAFFDADNRLLYALSNRGRDRKALVLIDPARPDAETLVFEHPTVDLWQPVWSRVKRRLTHVEFQTERTERHFVDAEARAMFERLARQLPGQELTLQSSTADETRFIVAASSDRSPGTRYLYNAPADSLVRLGDIAPWLPPQQMAPMQPIRYTSRDGLTIHGYLTLPVGRAPKHLPCVVNPHGGPWARDGWGFRDEVQFLANRGYCVLQMNFRGSTGYGRAFWEASFGQWGLKMQDDISDGVKWLVDQGIADPRRVGIYGASYGGYATLAGAAFTPELYAAAVSYVGVSNLFTFQSTIPPYWEAWRAQMEEMVGHPQRDEARLRATSPVFHADRIRAPLFVAQGARDPRVNKAESDQIVEALKKRGVPVQYMVKENEGHGFANEENRLEFYAAMEAFFRQHLQDAAPRPKP